MGATYQIFSLAEHFANKQLSNCTFHSFTDSSRQAKHAGHSGTNLSLPIFQDKVAAGFPSPASDFIEQKLDLNRFLIKHPSATFFVKVSGHSMIKAGIHHNDILIVDRALEPSNNKIVIAALDGELTVKRIQRLGRKVFLAPENPNFRPIEVKAETNFEIWGVVTNVIHSV